MGLASLPGLVPPERPLEYWTYLTSLAVGANLYAYFVANMTRTINDASASAHKYKERQDELAQWMRGAHTQVTPEPHSNARTGGRAGCRKGAALSG